MFGWLKEKGKRQVVAKALVSIIRTVLATGGGYGLALSDNDIEELAGLVAVVVVGTWGAIEKFQAYRAKEREKADVAIGTAAASRI